MKPTSPQWGKKALLSLGLLFLCILGRSVDAYILPGDFILQKTTERWEGVQRISLRCRVTRGTTTQDTSTELLFLQPGKLLVKSNSLHWTEPELPLPSSESRTDYLEHRPAIVNTLYLRSYKALYKELKRLGVATDQTSLGRVPSLDQSLPFKVVYQLGNDGRVGTPQIHIEKDTWLIRRFQFRIKENGPLWVVHYDGYGLLEGAPDWLPSQIQIYRGGLQFENIHVVEILKDDPQDAAFKPLPPTRKPVKRIDIDLTPLIRDSMVR